jgi:hypothetical protein
MVAVMRRLLTPLLCLVVLLVAFAPSASAKKCAMPDDYTLIKVSGGVTCAKAAKVTDAYFADNTATPFGFTCKQKQYPGGVTTVCRKGAKKIKLESAD